MKDFSVRGAGMSGYSFKNKLILKTTSHNTLKLIGDVKIKITKLLKEK